MLRNNIVSTALPRKGKTLHYKVLIKNVLYNTVNESWHCQLLVKYHRGAALRLQGKMEIVKPTKQAYQELQDAYSFFNRDLFEDGLPDCLMTLQRQTNTYGYYASSQFVSRTGEQADEIALNPSYFATRQVDEVLSTLVHEMCHLWQRHFGKPGRGRYHNREWAGKMKSVGLQPSHTGKAGGKEVGDQVTHFILDDGPFQKAYDLLIQSGYAISWVDKLKPTSATVKGKPSKKATRAKFTCPSCSSNAWGKPTLNVFCGECEERFEIV